MAGPFPRSLVYFTYPTGGPRVCGKPGSMLYWKARCQYASDVMPTCSMLESSVDQMGSWRH